MILVDKPYLSDYLKETSKKHNLPIVDTPAARDFGLSKDDNLVSEADTIKRLHPNPDTRIYTTSENAIGWIAENLAFTDLPAKIEIFKNKAKFRELMRPMLPDFYFREIPFAELDALDVNEMPFPFIIKPNVGFFSLGVHKVNEARDWHQVKEAIQAEVQEREATYPNEVLNTTNFIIEKMIEGEEFAFDAYYDENGMPVILGIYHHIFSSAADVGDRMYCTSAQIINENLNDFTEWLREIGTLAGMKNFPVHVEVRRTEKSIVPIEVNPLRFGGWCTTADTTAAAYSFNPYVYYFENQRPNWDEILSTRVGKTYSMVILDNVTELANEEIESFDYDTLLERLENPLELRRLDHKEYPIFGFLFMETNTGNADELDWMLKTDLREYITVSS